MDFKKYEKLIHIYLVKIINSLVNEFNQNLDPIECYFTLKTKLSLKEISSKQ